MNIKGEASYDSSDKLRAIPRDGHGNDLPRRDTRFRIPINKSDTHLPSRLHAFSFYSDDNTVLAGAVDKTEHLKYSTRAKQRSCSEDLHHKGLQFPKTPEIKKSNSINTYRTFRIDSLEDASPVHKEPTHRRKSKSTYVFRKQSSVPETSVEQHVASLRFWNNTVKRNSQPDSRLEDTRLVVLGSGNVGKSSLVQQFVNETFPTSYRPTLQDTHRHLLQFPGGVFRTIEIVDTAGIHQFPAMRLLSIQSADAFLVVYSVDNPESFHEAMTLVQLIKDTKSKQTSGPQHVQGQMWPIMVVGNKCDLSASRSVMEAHAQQKSSQQNCLFVEASAKDNDNVTKLFTELLVSVYGGEYLLKKQLGKHSISASDKQLRHKCTIV